ncbi:MAG: hypothetical protein FWG14_13235 [Peptococcaceae bacterium]|nr:hypothetical protein [Peptococcaceae bacterium]
MWYHALNKIKWRSDSEYFYDENVLEKIKTLYQEFSRPEELKYELCFSYDEKGKLARIKSFSEGGSRTEYSAEKINFKKLEDRIFEELIEGLNSLLCECQDETLYVLLFHCYIGDGGLNLFANSMEGLKQDKAESLEYIDDWKYCEFHCIDLIDFPLDEEDEKVLISVAKAIKRLVATPLYESLPKTDDFLCLLQNHDVDVLESNPKIKEILKDIPFLK